MATLVTVQELAVLLKTTIAADDPYATMMVEQASSVVREYARMPGWVRNLSDPAVDGEIVAPQGARDVALWVASRAYLNPTNMSRRTAGPISESFENGLWALELTPDEKTRLDGLTGGARTGGLWVQPIDGGYPPWGPIMVPTIPAPYIDDVLVYSDIIIADEGQFPYNVPDDSPGTEAGSIEYV